MEHRVAVRTNWHQILNRINNIVRPYLRYGNNVMDMYEPFSNYSVSRFKIESTYLTFIPFAQQTKLSIKPVPLIFLCQYGLFRSFLISK